MKNLTTTIVLTISFVLLSCNTQPSAPDVAMTILFDMTDKVTSFPTSDELLSPLNLKDQPYQEIHIMVSTISDKDINNTTILSLEKEDEWASNITIRRAKIQHLKAQLQQCLTAIEHTDTSGHSIIYRAVVAQANGLAAMEAKHKYLLVFSNLYENSDINFYNPAVLHSLQRNPAAIQRQLEQEAALQPLNGLDTWFVYNAASYRDNNHYRPVASLYSRIFQSHGSTVHIGTKFQPL